MPRLSPRCRTGKGFVRGGIPEGFRFERVLTVLYILEAWVWIIDLLRMSLSSAPACDWLVVFSGCAAVAVSRRCQKLPRYLGGVETLLFRRPMLYVFVGGGGVLHGPLMQASDLRYDGSGCGECPRGRLAGWRLWLPVPSQGIEESDRPVGFRLY